MANNSTTTNKSALFDPSCYLDEIGDPDITGLGVILSFILSIAIAMIAIFYAYVRRSLRPDVYNGGDDIFLRTWPLRFVARPRQHGVGESSQIARAANIEKFILAMSDQQLVTGTSILFVTVLISAGAGGIDQEWSVFAYLIAVGLSYFSWSLHLATLTALRQHFRKLEAPQKIRIGVMTLTLLSLFAARLIGSSVSFTNNPSTSLRCAFAHFDMFDDDDADIVSNLLSLLVGRFLLMCGMFVIFMRGLVEVSSGDIPVSRSLPWQVFWPPWLANVLFWGL
ncbi:Uu.00g091400.m01.CDS01 [Anthostomella pinea]|uniref:Uu.00g091400.m01.CDS01 n=1 Tax=Anthostomella pinea TaxID=933095 RepID=A0AAI8VN42_9PEZI|nr:Uu.00g091400.m01.CDS01 [Anthostomella pinea]